MLGRVAFALLAYAAMIFCSNAQDIQRLQPKPTDQGITMEVLTDAAIVAFIVAASIAAYKAMGRPCACPSDTMSNGRACGGNSAWSKPNGFKPLCFPTDVTASMISAYRATKAVPHIK